jgi:hypothetical protein
MTDPILYSAELELAEEDIPGFSAWYAGRHAADLYQAGFSVCTCYRAVRGGMNLIDFYEAPDAGVFDTEAYKQIGPRDSYGPKLMAKRRDKAHTVYTYRASTAGAGTHRFSADWVAFARFAATPEDAAKLGAALAGEPGASLLAAGASRVRLAERGPDHPRNPTHRPAFILIAEWDRAPPESADMDAFVAAHISTSGLDSFVGYRLYPWPDTPCP